MIPLGPDHTGFRCDVRNMLRMVGEEITDQNGKSVNGWAHSLQNLAANLGELSERFYAGDLKAVDEFLQLYCLDSRRAAAKKSHSQTIH